LGCRPVGTNEDLVHVVGDALTGFAEIGLVGHQPARLHVLTIAVDRRLAVPFGQFDDQLTERDQIPLSLTMTASGCSAAIWAKTVDIQTMSTLGAAWEPKKFPAVGVRL
jgi:hypothetical protein